MEADYSKTSLERFLEAAGKHGLFNANTLAGMKSAVARLLEDLEADHDVRKVDVEAATIRYHNKHPGDLSPNSLRTYESRLERLIEEFVKYNGDPAGYKPLSRPAPKENGERAARVPRSQKSRQLTVDADQVEDAEIIPALPEPAPSRTTPTAMSMQYPLRDDFIAQVLLPRGMTSEEARRLCAFIRTLAVDFSPEQ